MKQLGKIWYNYMPFFIAALVATQLEEKLLVFVKIFLDTKFSIFSFGCDLLLIPCFPLQDTFLHMESFQSPELWNNI